MLVTNYINLVLSYLQKFDRFNTKCVIIIFRLIHSDNQFILYYYDEKPAKAALVWYFGYTKVIFSFLLVLL